MSDNREITESGIVLEWGKNKRDGGEHTEWHAPCGCAFHPKPAPHWHPCERHWIDVPNRSEATATPKNPSWRNSFEKFLAAERVEPKSDTPRTDARFDEIEREYRTAKSATPAGTEPRSQIIEECARLCEECQVYSTAGAYYAKLLRELKGSATPAQSAELPIEMLLFCPRCSKQHVDEPKGEWTNPPHATHTCQHCGLLWRPSNANTTGVAGLKALEPKHVERIMATYPHSATEANEPLKLLHAIVDAYKLACQRRNAGFKGDLYWRGLESHIEAADEWLGTSDSQEEARG